MDQQKTERQDGALSGICTTLNLLKPVNYMRMIVTPVMTCLSCGSQGIKDQPLPCGH
jgi:hypothetical protein